jgi:hypothetical protein
MKSFSDLTERAVLTIAVASEEEASLIADASIGTPLRFDRS